MTSCYLTLLSHLFDFVETQTSLKTAPNCTSKFHWCVCVLLYVRVCVVLISECIYHWGVLVKLYS